MPILIACEESQAVTKAFRARGIEAYSCDVIPESGGHSEWHIIGDAIDEAYSGKYSAMIAFPPCTYLTNTGVRWLHEDPSRWAKLDDGAAFFKKLLDAPIEKIVLENPIPHKYALERIGGIKYTQIIHPWQHGHMEKKATCLWIKGLPKIIETDNVYDEMIKLPKNKQQRMFYMPPGPNRTKERSKTYSGIADAFGDQWSGLLKSDV